MPKGKVSRREWVWLLAPTLFLVGVGWWLARRPIPRPVVASDPGPLRLEVRMAKVVAPAPVDVSKGADARVQMGVVVTGRPVPPVMAAWDWEHEFSLVVVKNGKRRRVTDDYRRVVGTNKPVVFGGGGGGWGGPDGLYQLDLHFDTRPIPTSWGDLELQWDVVFAPSKIAFQDVPFQRVVNTVRQSGKGVATCLRIPIRKMGTHYPTPRVSTDPMFDVRAVEVIPMPNKSGSNFRIVLHCFYRGSLEPRKRNRTTYIRPAAVGADWGYQMQNGRYHLGATTSSSWHRTRGLRQGTITYETDIDHAQQSSPTRKRVMLRGAISLDGAWPLQITVPLDVTKLKRRHQPRFSVQKLTRYPKL